MEINKQRIAELVVKIQGGNKSAFDELYKLTSERAYFVALEFTKNNQDAEDILQESYIKALSKINELDKPESFSSWLNQIVANKSKDFLKKKKPMLFKSDEEETAATEFLPDEDTNFSPEENLDQTELQKTVMEVLDELSEEKRACVLMMYFEELSVGEIAETLEIPEGTVKTRLFSARKDLKDKFAKRGITSAFSFAPMGVVIWAFRFISDAASESFVTSGASANILAKISVAQAGTAASAAAAGTATASTAAAGAGSTAAASAVTTGSGIAAKIATLTVAQKIVAGVSVAAVVAGGTAGVVTVVNDNDKKDDISTTAYTEEYTTAPSFETTLAVDVLGTVEFTETTDFTDTESSASGSTAADKSTSAGSTANNTTAALKSTSAKQTTTKKQKATTTKSSQSSTADNSTATQTQTTEKETTAKATTTEEETTTKKATTTKKVTTTKVTTTQPRTATTQPTTAKETTTAKVPQVGYTTPVSEGTQIAVLKISIINLDNTVEKIINYTVPEGTVMTEEYLYSLCESAGYYPDFGFDGEAVGKTAQANETYTVDAKL